MSKNGTGLSDDLLVVIIDINTLPWTTTVTEMDFTTYLENILVFINSQLIMDHRNTIAVIASHIDRSYYVYSPDVDGLLVHNCENKVMNASKDGRHEQLAHINYVIEQKIKKIVEQENSIGDSTSIKLASALNMALCYINAHIHQDQRNKNDSKSRILVIKSTADTSIQYLSIMNCIFTAQKNAIPIDACILGKHSGFMQQACDITGGIYLRLSSPSGLVQYLMTAFLPNKSIREMLVLPPKVKVDYRTACFCHRKLIEVGYVCSVCLSISCKFVPVCPTCQTHFILPLAKKKRKM